MNGLNWIIHGFFIHGFLFMNPIIDVVSLLFRLESFISFALSDI